MVSSTLTPPAAGWWWEVTPQHNPPSSEASRTSPPTPQASWQPGLLPPYSFMSLSFATIPPSVCPPVPPAPLLPHIRSLRSSSLAPYFRILQTTPLPFARTYRASGWIQGVVLCAGLFPYATFKWRVNTENEGYRGSDEGQVYVHVDPVNDPPVPNSSLITESDAPSPPSSALHRLL